MINIHPAYNDAVTIIKPITVSIPTSNPNEDMSVYKGERQPDRHIKWVDPIPLRAKTEKDSSLSRGRQLFMTNCSSCHDVAKELTGPALAFERERRHKKWLYDFTRNNSKYDDLNTLDYYASCLKHKYNNQVMPVYENLTDQDLKDLYSYISEESRHLNPSDYPDFKKTVDSCRAYLEKHKKLSDELESLEYKYSQPDVKIENEQRKGGIIKGSFSGTASMVDEDSNLVKPVQAQSDYYTFDIKAFGWYNIDRCSQAMPGLTPCTLTVKVKGTFSEPMHVFLALPSIHDFAEGGLMKGSDNEYGFYTDDGHINLPLGEKGYVFTLAQGEKRLLWSCQSFQCTSNQTIELSPAEVSKSELYKAWEAFKIDDLDLKVDKVPHADQMARLKARLQEVEKLKPQHCDCNCGAQAPAPAI